MHDGKVTVATPPSEITQELNGSKEVTGIFLPGIADGAVLGFSPLSLSDSPSFQSLKIVLTSLFFFSY